MSKTITVDISDIYSDEGESVSEAIVTRAAYLVVGQNREKIDAALTAFLQEKLEETLGPAVEEACAGDVQPTTTWGEPRGEPMTMRAFLVKEAMGHLAEKRFGDSKSRLQTLIHEEIERAMVAEMRAAVKEAQAAAVEAVRARAADLLAEGMESLIRKSR